MLGNPKTRTMMPAAFMAIAGLLLGSVIGPGIGLEGSIGSAGASVQPKGFAIDQYVESVMAAALAEAGACPYEDQSNGFGGQKGKCAFECPAPGGAFTIDVVADDKHATVSGTASCGPYDQHCTGDKSCTATGGYDGELVGQCSGDSDEAVDSGLYINCFANAEDVGTGGPEPGPPENCIITEPVRVCYDPALLPGSLRPLAGLCGFLQCRITDGYLTLTSNSATPGIHLYLADGAGAGATCNLDGTCHVFKPAIQTVDGRTTISH